MVGDRSLGWFTLDFKGYTLVGGVRCWVGLAISGQQTGRWVPIPDGTVRVRTPDGREGRALVVNTGGELLGLGEAPFGG